MRRLEKEDMLINLSMWSEEPEDVELIPYENLPKEWLTDVSLLGGLQYLKWLHEAELQHLGFVSPVLIMRYVIEVRNSGEDTEQASKLRTAIVDHSKGKNRLLLPVPAGSVRSCSMNSGHWTLLALDFDARGAFTEVRYRDSLSSLCLTSRANAELLLRLFAPETALPQRTNACFQKVGSGDCGWFVLSWCEAEAAEYMSEGWAARGWPEAMVKKWKDKLPVFWMTLKQEHGKLEKERQQAEEKIRKDIESAEKKAKLAVKGDSAKAELLRLAIKAKADLSGQLWPAFITEDQLPPEMRLKIEQVPLMGLGICSKCRWSSGCLAWSSFAMLCLLQYSVGILILFLIN